MKKIIISIYPSVRNKIFQIYLSDLTGSTQGVSSLRKGVWCMKTSSFSSSSVLIHTGKVSIFVWKKKHFAQVFTGQQGGELKIHVFMWIFSYYSSLSEINCTYFLRLGFQTLKTFTAFLYFVTRVKLSTWLNLIFKKHVK